MIECESGGVKPMADFRSCCGYLCVRKSENEDGETMSSRVFEKPFIRIPQRKLKNKELTPFCALQKPAQISNKKLFTGVTVVVFFIFPINGSREGRQPPTAKYILSKDGA